MPEKRKSIMGGYVYSNRPARFKRMSLDSYSVRTGSSAIVAQVLPDECPLNRDTLGQVGWAFMHTICAHYPEHPSPEEKYAMAQFIFLFGRFYPCRMCGESFLEELNKHPPEVMSNFTLNRWLCRTHNNVNIKLGKPLYDCSRVLERWRLGWSDGSCLQPSRQ